MAPPLFISSRTTFFHFFQYAIPVGNQLYKPDAVGRISTCTQRGGGSDWASFGGVSFRMEIKYWLVRIATLEPELKKLAQVTKMRSYNHAQHSHYFCIRQNCLIVFLNQCHKRRPNRSDEAHAINLQHFNISVGIYCAIFLPATSHH